MSHKRKQQILILFACLAYSFAYTGRYSYNANITLITDFYGVSNSDAGLIGTVFFFAYGVGQLAHAFLCKYYPKRYIIPGVLALSASLNLAVFAGAPFAAFKYLWLANGICQSVLWPTLILTMSDSLEPCMMRHATFVMSLTPVIGTVIAYGGSALFNLFGQFRAAFLLGACLMLAIGLAWLIFYEKLTPPVGQPTKQTLNADEPAKQTKAAARAPIGVIAVCGVLIAVDNFVKDGLNTWTPAILKSRFGLGDSLSIILTVALPFCGMFGAMLALRMNRKIKDFRALSGCFLACLCLCIGGILLGMQWNSAAVTVLFLGVVSCFAHGINSIMTSIMPFALRDSVNAGLLAGLLNSAGYIGSTASAYGLGLLADNGGWNAVMNTLLLVAIGATVLAWGTVLVSFRHRRRKSM